MLAAANMAMGPIVLGLPLFILLFYVSGIFYFICALFVLKPLRRERNELIGALFAFLMYQAVAMFFMAIEMHTQNMIWGRVASLAVLIGSVYMLKFPFSYLGVGLRRIMFYLSVIVALGLFAWFISSPEREAGLMNFTIWYDVIVNGIVVGCFMIWTALRTGFVWFRIKAGGGAAGVVSCCVVANVAMVNGAMLTSSVFQFIAPIVILGALNVGRKMQKQG